MKCKLGKYLHIHLLVMVLAHIGIPILYFYVTILTVVLFALPFAIPGVTLDSSNNNQFWDTVIASSWVLGGITICATRCLILPTLFYHLEHSECIPVYGYIKLLKNNCFARIISLIVLILLTLLFHPIDFTDESTLFSSLMFLGIDLLAIDLVGCYLALFLWWKIRGELK